MTSVKYNSEILNDNIEFETTMNKMNKKRNDQRKERK
jgi:hypothetical protein